MKCPICGAKMAFASSVVCRRDGKSRTTYMEMECPDYPEHGIFGYRRTTKGWVRA